MGFSVIAGVRGQIGVIGFSLGSGSGLIWGPDLSRALQWNQTVWGLIRAAGWTSRKDLAVGPSLTLRVNPSFNLFQPPHRPRDTSLPRQTESPSSALDLSSPGVAHWVLASEHPPAQGAASSAWAGGWSIPARTQPHTWAPNLSCSFRIVPACPPGGQWAGDREVGRPFPQAMTS